jgi:hypothetical protein
MIKRPTILALLLVLGITTTQNAQTPPPPTTAPPSTAPAGQPPGFKNLQVFPHDIPRDRLITAMRGFTAGLGVKCNFCHVVSATEPKEVLDFPNDAKEEKRIARVMIQMVAQINGTYLPRVELAEHRDAAATSTAASTAPVPDEADNRVACWTCHRGSKQPDIMPAPAAH